MLVISNADRVVFPDVGRTKGDVVAYHQRIAPRAIVHAADRPLSIRRYPKGLADKGFFQKNVRERAYRRPMRSPRLLIVLAVAAVALTAHAQGRRPYTSTALGFTATFPYDVKEKVDPAGGGTAAGFDPAGIMYMVGVTPARPELARSKSAKEQLDDGLAGALAQVKGKLESQKDIKLGKHPGREVEIALQGGHATFRAFLVGARTILVGVVHMDGQAPPMPPAEFFASFKLNGKN